MIFCLCPWNQSFSLTDPWTCWYRKQPLTYKPSANQMVNDKLSYKNDRYQLQGAMTRLINWITKTHCTFSWLFMGSFLFCFLPVLLSLISRMSNTDALDRQVRLATKQSISCWRPGKFVRAKWKKSKLKNIWQPGESSIRMKYHLWEKYLIFHVFSTNQSMPFIDSVFSKCQYAPRRKPKQ